MFEPSTYQKDIFNWVEKTNKPLSPDKIAKMKNGRTLVVEALAGSGKTTTGVQALNLLPKDADTIFLAFNKHIATELQTRVPSNVRVQTYHALGYSIVRSALGKNRIDIDGDKIDKILKAEYDKYKYGYLFPPVRKLIDLIKSNLIDWKDLKALYDLAEYYGIDLNSSAEQIFDMVDYVINESLETLSVIDFNDMCWLPVYKQMTGHKYDFIFVDELQDTNKAQTELVLMSSNKMTRIMGVGDSRQSIYAFRGADSESMPLFIERLQAETLPLSITYRNPKSIVELVRNKFPDIPLQATDWAIDGEIITKTLETALVEIVPGDMILCRTNAPLIGPCFQMIRRGIKAIIRGRDIGQGLKSLIRKMKTDNLHELMKRLTDYQYQEIGRLMSADKTAQAQQIQDKVETIIALGDGCNTVLDIENRIDTVFSDEGAPIVFSSVHKAKGLEARNVYILNPELMPHSMAKKTWEKQQERNLEYVAITRTLEKLIYIVG